jgi:hypothetical protein
MTNVARLPDSRAAATPEPEVRPVFRYAELAVGSRLREVFNGPYTVPDETWHVVGVAAGHGSRFRRIQGCAAEAPTDLVDLENEATRERMTRLAQTLKATARWQLLTP